MDDKNGVVNDAFSLREMTVHIRELRIFLGAQKKIIFAAAFLGSVLGLLYSFIEKPRYLATTTFVLENAKRSSLGEYANIAARFGALSMSGGGLFQDDFNMITFLKSRTMVVKTLLTHVYDGEDSSLLADRFLEMKSYREDWKKNKRLRTLVFHTEDQSRTLLEDSVLTLCYKDILKNHLSVAKLDKEESVLLLSVNANDELFSKFFNETLLENASKFYTQMQTKKSFENVEILTFQVDSIRALLNSALAGVAATSEANLNTNPALLRLKVPSQKRMIDVEMNKAILEELVKNLELSKISVRKETPLIQVIDSPVFPLERQKLGKVKGVLFGGILFGLLGVSFFALKHFFRKVLAN